MSEDDESLAAYERAADRYAAAQSTRPAPPVLALMDRLATSVGAGARVLEIGSGTGQDARLLAERGLIVSPTDATATFVDMMRADGLDARRLDVRHDDLGGPWDAVWANAVFLHLSRDELADVLVRIRTAVPPGGVLIFTVKEGDGEAWTTVKLGLPRHFTYWREDGLRAAVLSAGWTDVEISRSVGQRDDWLAVVASRPDPEA